MDNYFDNFRRAFENSEFIRLTFQAFGIFVAIILLILIARFLKLAINNRIRKINNFTMDFNDLKKMRQTGLISDDEYERIKSGLVKRFVETPTTESLPSENILTDIPPIKQSQQKQWKQPAVLPTNSQQKSQKSSHAIDIDDLFKKGLITKEEYEKLSEIKDKNHNQ